MKTPSRFASKVVWDIETREVIERVPYPYTGPVELAKASSQEKALQASTQSFFKTLMADYNQQFAGQNAILGQLQQAFSPILSAGINQQGFSADELAAYRTDATNRTAAEYQKAATATNESLAAEGGGNTFLPTGAQAELKQQVANTAAQNEATANLSIDEANYAQGRKNFLAARDTLGSVAGMMNPTAYGGLASSEGSTAFNEANTIAQQNDTFGQVAGFLGGAATAWLGGGGGNPFAGKGGGGN